MLRRLLIISILVYAIPTRAQVTCQGAGCSLQGTATITVQPFPVASPAPTTIAFGTITVGNSSSPQNTVITNSSVTALTILSIGVSANYSLSTTCPITPSTLGAGLNCTVSVTFTPSAAVAQNGTLTLTDNASNSPQTVALTGTGGSVGPPIASINPTTLAFGTVNVGGNSTFPVTLQNTGGSNLTISSITTSAQYSQTNNCGASLSAGLSCTVNVTFSPAAPGSIPGTLSFTDNASGSPQAVTLTGAGQSSSGSPFITSGQGWHDLGVATQLQVSSGVNESPALCSANGAFSSGYNFTNQCQNAIGYAWNSGAWDEGNEKMWMCAQGGHGDYNGNDCWNLDIPSLKMVHAVLPTVPVSSNSPSLAYIPDGGQTSSTNCNSTTLVNGAMVCPNARHTYDGVAFNSATGELELEAGAVGPVGPLRTIDEWRFNTSTLQWSRIDTCGTGLAGASCGGQTRPGSAGETLDLDSWAYNPADGNNYMLAPFTNDFWKENATTHAWTKLVSGILPGGYGEYMVSVVDPVNNNLISIQANQSGQIIDRINLSTFVVTDETSHCGLAGSLVGSGVAPGVTYDSLRKQIVVLPSNLGNTIYVIDPVTFACTSETYSGGAPDPVPTNSSFFLGKRFAYSAKEDAYILVGGPFEHAFALRRTPFASSDFQNRCASPGVTLCQDFSSATAFTQSCNYPNVSPTVRVSNSCSGPVEIFQDKSTFASGSAAMRVDGPPQNGSFSDLSGGWYTWLGGTQISYGPGGNGATDTHNDLWIQFRWRINSQLAKTDWEALVGSSPKHWDMYNVAAGSCSSEELTMIRQGNANLNGFFDVYGGCGGFGYESRGDNSGTNWEQDNSTGPVFDQSSTVPTASGGNSCQYSGYGAPCAYEKDYADQWLTVQVHVHFNSWNTNRNANGTNYLDMWVAKQGQPLTLFKHFNNSAYFEQQGAGFKGFDTLLFENYMTSASCTGSCLTSWTTTASQWIGELLISSQQPPTPQQ